MMNPKSLFDPSRTRCGYNNSKVGMPTISTMPGTAASLRFNASGAAYTLYEELIKENTGCCTTCGQDCPGCYAMALKTYSAVFEKYLLNTIELFKDPDRFYYLVEKELYSNPFSAPRAVRMHEAGEFAGLADINAFFRFARRHPETIFFGYSKDKAFQDMQRAGIVPENVKFACSPWILADGTVLCAPVDNVYQYIYNDGTNRAHDAIVKCYCSNPDGTANKGATCADCGRCIRCKDGDKTAVFPHGVKLADSWLAGRTRLIIAETGADLTTAARAAYNEALTQAVPAWKNQASADLEKRVAKLVKAIKDADRKTARA